MKAKIKATWNKFPVWLQVTVALVTLYLAVRIGIMLVILLDLKMQF